MTIVAHLQRLLQDHVTVTSGFAHQRLELQIPWCNKHLHWQVLLASPAELSAPDFIFDDPSFLPLSGSSSPQQLSDLQGLLRAWPTTAAAKTSHSHSARAAALASSLATILYCLLSIFRDHQLSRLTKLAQTHHSEVIDRLQFELSTLSSIIPPPTPPAPLAPAPPTATLLPLLDDDEGDAVAKGEGVGGRQASGTDAGAELQASDAGLGLGLGVEALYLEPKGGEPGKACLGVPLVGLDLTRLAQFDTYTVSAAATTLTAPAKLHVTFRLAPGQQEAERHLQLAPWLQQLLPEVALPSWTPHSCLMEYVPQVVERVGAAVCAVCEGLEARSALLSALPAALGGARPLELNLMCGSGVWSVAWEGTPVLVSVVCGRVPQQGSPGFPEEQPAITLTSVRQLGCGPDNASRTYRSYPWSPRWAASEMASRIATWLHQELPVFLGTKPAAPPIAHPAAPAAYPALPAPPAAGAHPSAGAAKAAEVGVGAGGSPQLSYGKP